MKLALYRMATALGGPLIQLYLKQRIRDGKEDPARFAERLGHASHARPQGKLVWIHAASVGESLSVLPLIERIHESHPGWLVLVTTGTVTSAQLMAERLPKGAIHQYVPVDRVGYVRRFLEHWRPDLALWVESEFWPNLVVETRARAVPMVVLNGRMSARSFAKWRKSPAMIRQLLVAFREVLAQSEADAQHFRDLGAKSVHVPGNIKFVGGPLPVNADDLACLQAQTLGRPLWLAASTHAGEESLCAQAHLKLRQTLPGLLTVIVPRHPARGDDVAAELKDLGLNVAQRSQNQPVEAGTDVYIADTLGELGLFYRLADVVFVGKSLTGGGGQNPIEPALLDCALLFGPDMSNFADISQKLLDAGAALTVCDTDSLSTQLERLLRDETARDRAAQDARHVAEAEAGVLERVMAALAPYFQGGGDARA